MRRRQIGRVADLDLDRRIERAADQVVHALEQSADVDRPRSEILPPREGEQPLHQCRRAARRLQRGVDQPLSTRRSRQAPTQQIEVADDRGEQVVEVVGDAAGQLAERLQLLRLVQLGERKLVVRACAPTTRASSVSFACGAAPRSAGALRGRARASYCRRRARSAARARLTRVVGWNGRSRKVTLPSASSSAPPLGIALEPAAAGASAARREGRTIPAARRSSRTARAGRGRAALPRSRARSRRRSAARATSAARSRQIIDAMPDSPQHRRPRPPHRGPRGARISARSESVAWRHSAPSSISASLGADQLGHAAQHALEVDQRLARA